MSDFDEEGTFQRVAPPTRAPKLSHDGENGGVPAVGALGRAVAERRDDLCLFGCERVPLASTTAVLLQW